MALDGSRDSGYLSRTSLTVIAVVAVIIGVWSSLGGDDGGTDTATVRMTGTVTVYDQRACADGPMLRIHIGNDDILPISYPPANAPCRLRVDHEVAEASRYRFEVAPLSPVVRHIDALREPDGSLSVDISLGT